MSIYTTSGADLAKLNAILVRDGNPMIASISHRTNGDLLGSSSSNGNGMVTSNSTSSTPSKSLAKSLPMNGMEINLDSDLLSTERLDRASPDLWPEQIPGVTEFIARSTSPIYPGVSTSSYAEEAHLKEPPEWLSELSHDEMNMLQGFSSLTATALLDKVKELQDLAYQLGIEESREMTRGKLLDVLGDDRNHSTSRGQWRQDDEQS